jgi:ribosome biogenesis GTPase
MQLESLGADAVIRGAFQNYQREGLLLARVATAQRDQYRLFTDRGELAAEASGALWYRTPDRAGMPVAGDWVAARPVASDQAIVEAVLPRRTCFSRRAAGTREEQQSIAANIDLVFLVCGLDGDFNLRRLERYLTLTAESGASAVVVLNKSDLCADIAARMAETQAVANGAPVVTATTRDPEGLTAVSAFLGFGRTVALLGSSGVGKSCIVNRLLGEEKLRTNEVREWDSRGRHTTTHRELIPLPQGGVLIDTPGMREVQLWAGEESVDETFAEIAEAATRCRFRDCSHCNEEGCAVAAALAAGAISSGRWESYRKLRREARRHELMADANAAREHKRQLKRVHKQYRNFDKWGRL